MTASEISEFIAMNKAIVSKSVGVLTDRRLIVQAEESGRSRQLFLTPAGAEMHDAMLPISLRGQEIILGDLTDDEVTQLNELLRRLLGRVPELQAEDALDEASPRTTRRPDPRERREPCRRRDDPAAASAPRMMSIASAARARPSVYGSRQIASRSPTAPAARNARRPPRRSAPGSPP